MRRQLKVVDLFSGCGGFALGAHGAGFTPSVAIDVDPILTSSYQLNFPNSDVEQMDLLEVPIDVLQRRLGVERLTALFGGPPCQAFSDIGRRDPDDPRRRLLPRFFQIVMKMQPKFFIMENVRGLYYADVRYLLDNAVGSVSESYNIFGPVVLNAADFGAATNRRRLFVVGVHKNVGRALEMSDILSFRKAPATVKDAIGDLTRARYLREKDGFDYWKIPKQKTRVDYRTLMHERSLVTTGHRKTVHRLATTERFATICPGGMDSVGRHPRLAWELQCPTLRAGTGNDRGSYQSVRPIHPTFDRVITVREAARLQGFPDSFLFHPTVWHSFRMIGNSVCPLMSQALFRAVRAACGKTLSLGPA